MNPSVRKLDGYRPMVIKAAWQAWRRLPKQTQSWIGIEDMIQDGLEWMYLETKGRWNPRRASLSTFLTIAIEHYYYDHYVARYGRPMKSEAGRHLGSEKRWEGHLVSIEQTQSMYQEAGMAFELERALGVPVSVKEEEENRVNCLMVAELERVFLEASEQLQCEMVNWFLEEDSRWHLRNPQFRKAAKEFRELAERYQIGIDTCRHILRSWPCRQEFQRAIYRSERFDLLLHVRAL